MNFPPIKCSQKTTKFSQEYGMTTRTKKKKKKSNFLTSPKQGHFFKDLPS